MPWPGPDPGRRRARRSSAARNNRDDSPRLAARLPQPECPARPGHSGHRREHCGTPGTVTAGAAAAAGRRSPGPGTGSDTSRLPDRADSENFDVPELVPVGVTSQGGSGSESESLTLLDGISEANAARLGTAICAAQINSNSHGSGKSKERLRSDLSHFRLGCLVGKSLYWIERSMVIQVFTRFSTASK